MSQFKGKGFVTDKGIDLPGGSKFYLSIPVAFGGQSIAGEITLCDAVDAGYGGVQVSCTIYAQPKAAHNFDPLFDEGPTCRQCSSSEQDHIDLDTGVIIELKKEN